MKALNSSLANIRRTPYQALVAILITTLTFFIAYCFSLALLGAESILHFFETRPQVIAFFKIDANQESTQALTQEMQAKAYVDGVRLITKDEALKIYQQDNQDNPLLLELVTADILPASIEVSAHDLAALSLIKEDLAKNQAIEDVVLQEDIIESLQSWSKALRLVATIIIVVLSITSILMMSIIISLKIANKKYTINIMRLIGANYGFIYAPFFLEVNIYAMIGALVGWLLMYALLLYSTPFMREFLAGLVNFPLPWYIFGWQILIGLASAFVLATCSSFLVVKRLIRK